MPRPAQLTRSRLHAARVWYAIVSRVRAGVGVGVRVGVGVEVKVKVGVRVRVWVGVGVRVRAGRGVPGASLIHSEVASSFAISSAADCRSRGVPLSRWESLSSRCRGEGWGWGWG